MKFRQSVARTPETQHGSVARWAPDFFVLSIVWGSSFALIKIAVDAGLAPMWVAFGRCLFGALTLVVICTVRREKFPSAPSTWRHAVVVALLLNVLPFTFLAYGETQVSSVLAGILNATVPLTTLLFVPILVPQEQMTTRRVLGLLVGFVGVLVVLGLWNGLGKATLTGSLACLASTCFLGAGFAYTRRFFSVRGGSASVLSAVQLICATVALTIATPVVSGLPTWPGWAATIGLVVLGAAGTGIAYILNIRVIRVAGPTVASTVTYVIPLWSILLGTLALSEPLSWNAAVGAVLVLGGVLLTRPPRRRAHPADPPAVAAPTADDPVGVDALPPSPEETSKGSRTR
jgi:drug/metabolite transporter (DMT)-like permease